MQELANFFERRVSTHQVAVAGEVAFDGAFRGLAHPHNPEMVHSPSPRKWPTVRASEVTKAPWVVAPRPEGS